MDEEAIERLKQSEELFARAFLMNPLPMTITNGETQRFTAVNEGFLQLVGYWRVDLIGRTSSELGLWVLPADREEVGEKLRSEGSTGLLISAIRRKDGREVAVQVAFQLLTPTVGAASVLSVVVPQAS